MFDQRKIQQHFSQVVGQLLSDERLLGEVIVRLPRSYVDDDKVPVYLAWHEDELTLYINVPLVASMRLDEMEHQLAHEAYHVIWGHPVRYLHTDHPQLAAVACDMAVNEYLDEPPAGSWTRATVEKITRISFPARAGSADYLQQLLSMPLEKQQQLASKMRTAGSSTTQAGHYRWINADTGNDLKRRAQVRQLTRQAYQSLTERQRGLLPGTLTQELHPSQGHYALPLQTAIWHLLGQVPSGYTPSRARFNRRQPWRMDLMGQVTKYNSRLYVFVDNSGSMGDADIGRLLDLCQRLVNRLDTEMILQSFDARLQGPVQQVSGGRRVKFVRYGGGGTSYQPIFDWLRKQGLAKNVPVIVLTDGWGESEVNQFGFRNVLWLLTTNSPLSVRHPLGQVVHLRRSSK